MDDSEELVAVVNEMMSQRTNMVNKDVAGVKQDKHLYSGKKDLRIVLKIKRMFFLDLLSRKDKQTTNTTGFSV